MLRVAEMTLFALETRRMHVAQQRIGPGSDPNLAAARPTGTVASDATPEDGDEPGTGFWGEGGLRAPYFVRPCRKRFDLYHLSATPPAMQWHQTTMAWSEEETDADK